MNFCPSCGQQNPENARFCSECKTRLPHTARTAAADPLKEAKVLATAPEQNRTITASRLSIISIVLGALGLGIPAIITGAMVLKRRLAGRRFAVAGIVLGSIGTIILVALLAGAFSGPDENVILYEDLTPDRVPAFTSIVMARTDRIEERGRKVAASLGALGAGEMAPIKTICEGIREDLDELRDTEYEEDLKPLQDAILAKMEGAERLIQGK